MKRPSKPIPPNNRINLPPANGDEITNTHRLESLRASLADLLDINYATEDHVALGVLRSRLHVGDAAMKSNEKLYRRVIALRVALGVVLGHASSDLGYITDEALLRDAARLARSRLHAFVADVVLRVAR